MKKRLMKTTASSDCEKTKPIQTQFRIPGKQKASQGFFRVLVAGKIEFLDGFDILLERGSVLLNQVGWAGI